MTLDPVSETTASAPVRTIPRSRVKVALPLPKALPLPISPASSKNAAPPPRYFNREVSWLEFNGRVLEEAMDGRHPLLEQVKFLSIFHSNLDEFFMIRVSGLQEQVESGLLEPGEDGLTPPQQLAVIRERVLGLYRNAWHYFQNSLRVRLKQENIHLLDYAQLSSVQKNSLRHYFETEVYPVLTPLAVDPSHPFPHISNQSLSLAIVLRDPEGSERFARVKIPQTLPRFVPVPGTPPRPRRRANGHAAPAAAESPGAPPPPPPSTFAFVWLEQLIAAHLESLFRGMRVVASYAFGVVRDADIEIREDEAGDLLQTIEESLVRRRFGSVTQLTVAREMPSEIRAILQRNLSIEPDDIYEMEGPLCQNALMSLYEIERPDLKDAPFRPFLPASLRAPADLFASIRERDILLHHPYDSFTPVIDFVRAAANDPNVLAIKQTIYRVGSRSPIIEALTEAAMDEKQVAALVELKARFDEENNIEWARALENAGAYVAYGDVNLKTHCKVLLVVRREEDGIRRYVHLSTGNYNARTAAMYTDLGLFTCDPDIGQDVSDLFNTLTGYSVFTDYRKLLVSPGGVRRGLMERIEREIQNAEAGRDAHIVFKCNTLSDLRMVDALYRASQAGVRIDLVVRGGCCLVPGVPGMSENIRVRSIVGRFLEHHRIYYFRNDSGVGIAAEQEEVWLGSADLMRRNLDRRIECVFPVEAEDLKHWLAHVMLPAYLRDNQYARLLHSDGRYERIVPTEGEVPFDAQGWFLRHTQHMEIYANRPDEEAPTRFSDD